MILNNYNSITGTATEWDMQNEVEIILKENKYAEYKYPMPTIIHTGIIVREVRIPEVHRISDHILYLPYSNPKIINIECKLDAIGCVIEQATDHLKWCDYSIIILPPDRGYLANKYKTEIIEKGLGLFYWFRGIGIYEFILPKYNRNKSKELRLEIIKRVIR
jgi:hypothetical protein